MNIIRIRAAILGLLTLSLNGWLLAAGTDTNATVGTANAANITTDKPPSSSAIADLNDLITRINQKLQAGQKSESNLADNIKEFDALLARHKDAQPQERGRIFMMKAQLFDQVLDQPERALEVYKQFKHDLPDLQVTGGIDEVISDLEKKVTNLKIQKTLVPGAQFPDFDVLDINGKRLALSDFKGKVVLLDFWATWCQPCMMELPNVQKAFEKYHDKGFDIVGVSLDIDKPKLENFIKDKKMPWQQYNDGKFWDTKLVTNYGIASIPATFLLDQSGRIIATNLRGDELEKTLAFATLPWLQRHLVSSGRAIDGVVRGYPYPSLGVIFLAGLLLGPVFRRKVPKHVQV